MCWGGIRSLRGVCFCAKIGTFWEPFSARFDGRNRLLQYVYRVTDADIAKEVDMETREQDIAKLGYVNEI